MLSKMQRPRQHPQAVSLSWTAPKSTGPPSYSARPSTRPSVSSAASPPSSRSAGATQLGGDWVAQGCPCGLPWVPLHGAACRGQQPAMRPAPKLHANEATPTPSAPAPQGSHLLAGWGRPARQAWRQTGLGWDQTPLPPRSLKTPSSGRPCQCPPPAEFSCMGGVAWAGVHANSWLPQGNGRRRECRLVWVRCAGLFMASVPCTLCRQTCVGRQPASLPSPAPAHLQALLVDESDGKPRLDGAAHAPQLRAAAPGAGRG